MDKWQEIRLGEFLTLKRGYDLPSQLRAIGGTIPIVSSSGISGYHNEAKISPPGVVTGRYGSVGAVFYVEQPFWPLNTTLYVEDFKGNNPLFTYYLLQSLDFQKYSDKTSVPGVNRNDLHRIRLLLPPLPEQRKIAEILYTWDEAITTRERLLTSLRERKKGLMQRMLSGQVRFAEFEKSKEKQSTRFGETPVDWGYVRIAEVAQHASEKNNKGDDLPVLSCTKHDGLVDSLTYFGRQIFSDDTSTYKVVRRGQFAYATNHIEEGSIGYQNLYDRALISPMYTVFETNAKVDDRYLYLVLKTETYRQIFEQNTNASVNRRGSLRWKEFSKIEIPLPEIEEQRRIADLAGSCDHEIELNRRKFAVLKQQKKGLIQHLLTGKIRVKVD